jgi:hypothetical protein
LPLLDFTASASSSSQREFVFCILPSRAGHATAAAAAAAEKAVVTNVVLSERCGRNNRKTNNDGSFEKGEEGNRVMIKSGKTFQTASYLEFLWPGNIGDRHLILS